jgi:paraquat-inducible protein A
LAGSFAELIDCPDCGTLQRVPQRDRWTVLFCKHCQGVLERSNLRSEAAALAVSFSALLLFIPALTFPFLTTSILGAYRTSRLYSSSTAMFADGWPALSFVIFAFIVAAPLVRFSLMTGVLGALHFNRHPRWLGRAFRYANGLQTWAMTDVYLIGMLVAYFRLKTSLVVEMGIGAECFIAVGILSLFLRALLDQGEIWRRIFSQENTVPEPLDETAFTCDVCELIVPARLVGHQCPRCSHRLARRRPAAVQRAVALTIAGAILYIPANAYPIATLPIGFSSVKYTVIEGVIDLAKANLWGLALLVLTASFAIPLLKLAGIVWCIASVLMRSESSLRLKTRVFRVIEEIGRWSMIDPFVISCFVPITQYNALIYGRAEPAAPAFTAVVILTIVATKCFDPRLMWDVQGKNK